MNQFEMCACLHHNTDLLHDWGVMQFNGKSFLVHHQPCLSDDTDVNIL